MRTAGATTEPEQGRRVMLMVAAAFGLPETFFGDASTGSLATAVSLDRPTELKFLEAQERWREVLQRIARFVLTRSCTAPKGKLREKANGKNVDQIVIDVKFPSILEHDITARVTAIVEAMNLNGFQTTGIDERTGVGLLLAELGVEDVQGVLEAMYPEKAYKDKIDRTQEPDIPVDPATGLPLVPQTPGPSGSPGAPPVAPKPRSANPKRVSAPKEAATMHAVAELRRALKKLEERKLLVQ